MTAKRQISKRLPKERAEQIARLREIIAAHTWFGMMTLRFPEGFAIEDERRLIRKICHMLTDRFRADGLRIGFLIKREFGKRPRRALHYHVVFTSPDLANIPEATLCLIKKAWLRIVGLHDNSSRCFDWKCPHDGEYLKKWKKSGDDVTVIPVASRSCNLSPKIYHTRGLGRRAGLSKSKVKITCDAPKRAQSSSPVMPSATQENTPYWRQRDSRAIHSAGHTDKRSVIRPYSWGESTLVGSGVFTQNSSMFGAVVLTQSFSDAHTNRAESAPQGFTQNQHMAICRTCEYLGYFSPVITGIEACPLCSEPWGRCAY